MTVSGPWPLRGTVVWLTAEQGGRRGGPPTPSPGHCYATVAHVPPYTVETGLASFALRGFTQGAWISPAEGHWLVVAAEGPQRVEPGDVVVICEGRQRVAYFHVERVDPA